MLHDRRNSMGVTRRPNILEPRPGDGGSLATAVLEPDRFSRQLLSAMLVFRDGKFGVRLPSDLLGVNEALVRDRHCDVNFDMAAC